MSDWIEWRWTPEKPYPETLETEVYVAFTDEVFTDDVRVDHDKNKLPVSFWYGEGTPSTSNWFPGSYASISHYKVVK